MAKILGLDLGTNSIGWAFIDDVAQCIVDLGVRIFPEGVNRDTKGKELPKNLQRRLKRQSRRQLMRRKYRKWKLARFLMKYGMFPTVDNLEIAFQQIPLSSCLQEFFMINPYACRSKAINGERLALMELGRVFYHFAQRRGYKVSIKDDHEQTGKLYDGDVLENKTGINETQHLIEQHQTLGNALYQTDPHVKRWRNRATTRSMYVNEFTLIWKNQQHFYPDVLTDELMLKIGDATTGLLFFQHPLKPQSHLVGRCTLEKNKKRCSSGCIAFELRRMWEFINNIRIDGQPLSLVQRQTIKEFCFSKEKFGFNEVAKKLKISPNRFNYEAEKLIVGTRSISSLRKIFTPKIWDGKSLEEQEAIYNIKRFAEDKLKTIAYVKQKFSLNDKQALQFVNFRPAREYSQLSYKVTVNMLPFLEAGYKYHHAVWLSGIVNVFGKPNWDSFTAEKQYYIVENAIEIYEDETRDFHITTCNWLMAEFNQHESALKRLYHHTVEKGNGEQAFLPDPDNVRNPIVQQALLELKKLVNTLIVSYGKPDEIKVELSRELKSSADDRDQIRLMQYKQERENDTIKKILDDYDRPHTTRNIQKLKLFREIERKSTPVRCPYTNEVISINMLFDDRIIDIEHIFPYSICLDDSFSNKTLCFEHFNRLKGNLTPFEFFQTAVGQRSWEEVKETALHILPYTKWLRFIDSKPKVFDEFAARKLNDNRYISRRAMAYLENICKSVQVSQGEVTAKLRHYWGLDALLNPAIKITDLPDGEYFVAIDEQRQVLAATRWQQQAKANDVAFNSLAKQGVVLQGNVKKGRFFPYKTRYDHRHHAIDALTVAFTKKVYLQALSTVKAKGMSADEWLMKESNFPEPWTSYYQQAQIAINNLIVSHKQRHRVITPISKTVLKFGIPVKTKGWAVRGALHDESLYGRRVDNQGLPAFHITKLLNQLTKRAQVDKIVDSAIKNLIQKAIIDTWQLLHPGLFEQYVNTGLIKALGSQWIMDDNCKEKYDIPDGAFFITQRDEKGKLTGLIPKVYLESRSGKRTPVKKVRIRENSSGAKQLKKAINQWVEPGSNYGVAIYEAAPGIMMEKIVTFWEAVQFKKAGLPPLQAPDNALRIIATLQINDLFLLGLKEDINWDDKNRLAAHLYRVQKLSSMYYVFRKVNAATQNFDKEQIRITSFKAWKEYCPQKVVVDILGRIQPEFMKSILNIHHA